MTHYLDGIGAVLGLFSTLLLIRSSILAWPVGISSIALNSLLYWHSSLFADTALQCLYLALYCYGWYFWKQSTAVGGTQTPAPILRINATQALWVSTLSISSIIIISTLLTKYTSSTTPISDAISTVLALAAQWLTCKKIIENWILWFFNDLSFSCLYAYKGLPFHVGEYAFYLILAVIGYYSWQKKEQHQLNVELVATKTIKNIRLA